LIVDLVLTSLKLAEQVVYYRIYKIDYRSNYRVIDFRFDTSLTKAPPKERYYLFKNTD
ncbi:uncharacterized protein K452DRAFT_239066, partial [Aplosporella prunicola CBS 121167]